MPSVYIYDADIYCEACGEEIKARIKREGKAPTDPEDERTFDSDEFPKGPFSNGCGEADSVHFCGSGETCLNALEIDGIKYGCCLENPLTSEGVNSLQEAINKDPENPVVKFQFELYKDDYDFTLPGDEEDEEDEEEDVE
jgi:hypothetical protein